MNHRSKFFVLATCVMWATAWDVDASERRFTYTYESLVLNPGDIELEPWTTYRAGRSSYYRRFDERLEIEAGLTENLQTAFYINFSGITADDGTDYRSTFDFKGISSEWKYKLSDPVADGLGSAFYVEATGQTDELELEAKLIVDKRLDNILFAANLVGEYEWEFSKNETEKVLIFELDLALAYLLNDTWSLGLEIRQVNDFTEGGSKFAHATLFAGPSLSYTSKSFWAAFTLLPQIRAFKGKTDNNLVLDGHERLESRLIFGIHL